MTDETSMMRELTIERDEARAEVTRQHQGWTDTFAQLDLAGREAHTLRALFLEVEWGGPAHTQQRWACERCARYHVGGSCEWCGACQWKGHAPDCRLKAALDAMVCGK